MLFIFYAFLFGTMCGFFITLFYAYKNTNAFLALFDDEYKNMIDKNIIFEHSENLKERRKSFIPKDNKKRISSIKD